MWSLNLAAGLQVSQGSVSQRSAQLQQAWKGLTLNTSFFFPSFHILVCLIAIQAIRARMPFALTMW